MLDNIVFSRLKVVADKNVKNLRGLLRVVGHDLNQAAGFGVHCCEVHHLGLVFTETLAALNGVLLLAYLLDEIVLFNLVVGKIDLVFCGDLIQRRFRDKHPALADKRGSKAVKHSQQHGADMEAVDVGVGTDDDLVPPQSVHIEGGKVFVRLALYLYSAA